MVHLTRLWTSWWTYTVGWMVFVVFMGAVRELRVACTCAGASQSVCGYKISVYTSVRADQEQFRVQLRTVRTVVPWACAYRRVRWVVGFISTVAERRCVQSLARGQRVSRAGSASERLRRAKARSKAAHTAVHSRVLRSIPHGHSVPRLISRQHPCGTRPSDQNTTSRLSMGAMSSARRRVAVHAATFLPALRPCCSPLSPLLWGVPTLVADG